MRSYFALIDEEDGKYGITFPDLPGCVAMAEDFDEVALRAQEALALFVAAHAEENLPLPPARKASTLRANTEVRGAMKHGAAMMLIELPSHTAERERVNVMLDKNLLAAVDRAVAAADMTRSGFIEEGLRIRLEVIRKVASFKIGSSRPANISPEFWERFLKNTYSTEMAANHIRSMSQNSVGKESEKTNTRRSGTRVFKHSKKA